MIASSRRVGGYCTRSIQPSPMYIPHRAADLLHEGKFSMWSFLSDR